MKLYATTTSERASKGQGGQRYMDIYIKCMNEITEMPDDIARVSIRSNSSGKWYMQFTSLVSEQDCIVELPEDRYTKGKQKKDECGYVNCSRPCVSNTDYCELHQLP